MAIPPIPPSAPFQPSQYAQDYWINPTNGSDSNSGQSMDTAWLTLDHAISVLNPLTTFTLNLMGGTYNVGVTPWTFAYANVVAAGAAANEVVVINSDVYLDVNLVNFYGIQFSGDIISTGSNPVTFNNCVNADGGGVQLNTSLAYINNCDFEQSSSIVISGNGYAVCSNSRLGNINVEGGYFIVKDSSSVKNTTCSAGVVYIQQSIIYSNSDLGHAITSTSTSQVLLKNVTCFGPSETLTGLSLAGASYAFDDVNYLPSASTITATNLGIAAYFDAINLIAPLPIGSGGTNATATPTAGGVSYGTGSAYAFTAAGTSGQVLTSNGSSAPTWQNVSSGSHQYTKTYWIDPVHGSDSNTGASIEEPWQTITHAVSALASTPNVTINLMGGFYTESPITIANTNIGFSAVSGTIQSVVWDAEVSVTALSGAVAFSEVTFAQDISMTGGSVIYFDSCNCTGYSINVSAATSDVVIFNGCDFSNAGSFAANNGVGLYYFSGRSPTITATEFSSLFMQSIIYAAPCNISDGCTFYAYSCSFISNGTYGFTADGEATGVIFSACQFVNSDYVILPVDLGSAAYSFNATQINYGSSILSGANLGYVSVIDAVKLITPLAVTSGGTGLSSTVANQILYSSATNTIAGLATANTSVLTTNGSGVPGYTAYVSTSGSPAGGTSNIVARDANGNSAFNNIGLATQGNAASGTVTLTAASASYQVFSSGSGTAILVLPDATTIPIGAKYYVNNNASGVITIHDNAGGLITTMQPGSFLNLTLLSASFPAGQWDYHWCLPSNSVYGTAGLKITGTLACGSSGTQFAVNTSGAVTAGSWTGSTVAIGYGGTNATATPTAGAVAYGTGTAYAFTAAGSTGQVLTSNGTAAPTWANSSAEAHQYTKVYWIDPVNGSDSNLGTSMEDPWKTLQYAATTLGASTGFVLNMMPGTYSGAAVTFNGATYFSIISPNSNYNTLITADLTIENGGQINLFGLSFSSDTLIHTCSDVTISNCYSEGNTITFNASTTQVNDTDFSNAVAITCVGTGNTFFNNCQINEIANSGNYLLIQACNNVIAPTCDNGTMQIQNSTVYATTSGGHAVSSLLTGTVILDDVVCFDSTDTLTGVSLAGSGGYLFIDVQYSPGLSTISSPYISQTAYTNQISANWVGVEDNSTAGSGYVGQIISSTVGTGSAISLTTGDNIDVTTITLTSGDWDVWGQVEFIPAGSTTISSIAGWVNSASATQPQIDNINAAIFQYNFPLATGNNQIACISPCVVQVASSSTVTMYLTVRSSFGVSSMQAAGAIIARRRR